MKIDWKFAATLVIAIASGILPIWLWQADIKSKSIKVDVVSNIPLYSEINDIFKELAFTIEGSFIDRPHYVHLRIKNVGSRPVLTSDWESPLYLEVPPGSIIKFLKKLNYIDSSLNPSIENNEKKITISPMLLNPGDSFGLLVITAGEPPTFNANARIAGVSKIMVDDLDKGNALPRRLYIDLLFGIFCSIIFITSVKSLIYIEDRQGRSLYLFLLTFGSLYGIFYYLLYTLLQLRLKGADYLVASGLLFIFSLMVAYSIRYWDMKVRVQISTHEKQ